MSFKFAACICWSYFYVARDLCFHASFVERSLLQTCKSLPVGKCKRTWIFQQMKASVKHRCEKLPDSFLKSFFFNPLCVAPIVFTMLWFLWNKYICTSMEDVINLMQKYQSSFCALHWQSWGCHAFPSNARSCNKWIFLVDLLSYSEKFVIEDQNNFYQVKKINLSCQECCFLWSKCINGILYTKVELASSTWLSPQFYLWQSVRSNIMEFLCCISFNTAWKNP